MKCVFYLFGNFGNKFCQFPSDYSRSLFEKFRNLSNASSRIITHRDNDLMYYSYVRQLDSANKYIGLCVVLNGVFITSPQALAKPFGLIINELALKGDILRLSEEGNLTAAVKDLSEKKIQIGEARQSLEAAIRPYLERTRKLPPVNYEIAPDTVKFFDISECPADLGMLSAETPFVSIGFETDEASLILSGYQNVLKKLKKKNDDLLKQKEDLQVRFDKLKKQKQNFTKVIWLLAIVIICGIGLLTLFSNLSDAKDEIHGLNADNEQLTADLKQTVDSLDNKRKEVHSLSLDLKLEKQNVSTLKSEKATLKSELSGVKSQNASLKSRIQDLEEANDKLQKSIIYYQSRNKRRR